MIYCIKSNKPEEKKFYVRIISRNFSKEPYFAALYEYGSSFLFMITTKYIKI